MRSVSGSLTVVNLTESDVIELQTTGSDAYSSLSTIMYTVVSEQAAVLLYLVLTGQVYVHSIIK